MVLWGVIADRFHCRKTVWLFTSSTSTVIMLTLSIPFIYQSFLRILIVSVSAQLFVSNGILDAYTLERLGVENKMYYGRYRLYASLSWGLGSIIMGWVTDHYGFDWNFIMFGLLSAMMIVLVAAKIPDTNRSNTYSTTRGDDQLPEQQSSKIFDLILIALRPRVSVFLLEVLVMGAGMATVERLLFLYMVNDLDASTLLCGLSVGVNVLFELPIFWYASSIMKKVGHDGMFLMSMACFVFRVYGYTWLTPATKWWILALESMHGVTFATFWIVTTDVSKVLVETEGAFWNNAIPMSVQMLYSAVGVSIGSVLGGWAMDRFGSRTMYTFTAGMVFSMMIVHIIGSILTRTFCRIGSFLPDYPHSGNQVGNQIHRPSGHEDSSSQNTSAQFDGEDIHLDEDDHEMERAHMTTTDIIQIGCLLIQD
jgi:MFS family permease